MDAETASKTRDATAEPPALKARVQEELRRYLILSAYLYVCFGAVMLFEVTQSEGPVVSVWHLGTVAGKALIVGKFVLLGDAARVGERIGARTVLQRIAWRTALLTVLLVVLTAVEEMVVGSLHGRSAAHTLVELFGTALPATAAKTLLMMLILVPLVTVTEIGHALGPGAWRRLLHRVPSGTPSDAPGLSDGAPPDSPAAGAADGSHSRRTPPRSQR